METTTISSPSPRIRWLPAVLGFVAMMGLGALLAFGVAFVRGELSPKLDAAPDFTLPLYSGGTGQFTLSQQLGHPVVLNFWASWCPPCLAEFPALQVTANKYAGEGLVVVGVAINDTEDGARTFLKEQNITFFTAQDMNGQVALDYRVTGLPATFFITTDGHIHNKWLGQIDEARLNTFIEELLKS